MKQIIKNTFVIPVLIVAGILTAIYVMLHIMIFSVNPVTYTRATPQDEGELFIDFSLWKTLFHNPGKAIMQNLLYLIAVVLLALWAIGFLRYHAGPIIHVLLIISVIAVILRLLQGKYNI